ncbi:peptidase cysteine/serine, trypsin-like protein [Pochonia chlamydosporia 170]|uniref:Peptidase cysteine/serine, trypsin-like protein n=1 Tax=Pochonia chlamydosporia 170 TaxID=1380566 RepID=A0A179F2D0_METCM|nr:peptidase cysteine/serine, trypsin-like protein [Pochonia chlamydosporia 170]OAQ59541.1 peptidase cysteine/serine, trypsin-like protein [Pochonia chlamydosporia 170]
MRAYQLLAFCVVEAIAAPWSTNLSPGVPSTAHTGVDIDLADITSSQDSFRRQAPLPAKISSAEDSKKAAPGGGKLGVLYRGDSRPPDEIFRIGFTPKGNDRSLQGKLSFHVNSAYVSTSRSPVAASMYAFGQTDNRQPTGYIYVLAPDGVPDGYWFPDIWRKDGPVLNNQEFAVDGSIPASSISHAYQVTQDNPSSRAIKIKNPGYIFRSCPRCTILKRAICDPANFVEDEGLKEQPATGQQEEPKKPTPGGNEDGKKPPTEAETGNTDKAKAGNDAGPPKSNQEPDVKMTKLAEKISENEFNAIVAKHKLGSAPEFWKTTVSQARTTIIQPLVSKMKPPRVVIKGLGRAIPGVVDVFLTAGALTKAFLTETSALDRASTGTSLVPLVGCGVGAAANNQDGKTTPFEGVDTALCFIGDELMLSAVGAPIGMVVSLVRMIVSFFSILDSREKTAKTLRDEQWNNLLDEKMTRLVISKEFRVKLQSSLALDSMVVASYGADWIGQLVTNSTTEAIRAEVNAQIVSRQRQFLLNNVPVHFSNLLKSVAEEYNKEFIEKWKSAQKPPARTPAGGFGSAGERFAEAQAHRKTLELYEQNLVTTAQKLRDEPPTLPADLSLAYYIGVAAGFGESQVINLDDSGRLGSTSVEWRTAVQREVIEPNKYYTDITGKQASEIVDRDTTAVAEVLQGKITEAELPSTVEGLTNVKEFHLLIAMNLGRLMAGYKKSAREGDGRYFDHMYDNDKPGLLQQLRNFDQSSMVYSLGSFARYIALCAGFTKEQVEQAFNGKVPSGLDDRAAAVYSLALTLARLHGPLGDAVFEQAREVLGRDEVAGMAHTVCGYIYVAMLSNISDAGAPNLGEDAVQQRRTEIQQSNNSL